MRWLLRGIVALALFVVFVAIAVVVLGRVDSRFAVSDWRVVLVALTGWAAPAASADGSGLAVAQGYSVRTYASGLPNARTLRVTAAGDLLVAQPREGRITLLGRDANGDGKPDRQIALLDGLHRPYGIDIHEGWLYVAEGAREIRVRFDATRGAVSGPPQVVLDGVPAGGNHWTRTLRVGPDGWLYLSVGSTCNVCVEEHPWRAALVRFRPDGSGAGLFASGLRNTVGFDWAPWDGALYGTDNGRDMLGDDFPPCELNRIDPGGFYGWPYVNGFGVKDPDFGDKGAAQARTARAPAHGFRAHNAPLGMTFLRHVVHGPSMARSALVALHGSWNRSVPDGYKVVQLQWDADGTIREREFLGGFLAAGGVRGRPADVAEGPDGTIYVADDYAGAIHAVRRAVPAAGGRE